MDLLLSCVLGEMRARAMVCRSVEGVGMGLKFMQMAAHDRAKLNQLVTRPEAPDGKIRRRASLPAKTHYDNTPSRCQRI